MSVRPKVARIGNGGELVTFQGQNWNTAALSQIDLEAGYTYQLLAFYLQLNTGATVATRVPQLQCNFNGALLWVLNSYLGTAASTTEFHVWSSMSGQNYTVGARVYTSIGAVYLPGASQIGFSVLSGPPGDTDLAHTLTLARWPNS